MTIADLVTFGKEYGPSGILLSLSLGAIVWLVLEIKSMHQAHRDDRKEWESQRKESDDKNQEIIKTMHDEHRDNLNKKDAENREVLSKKDAESRADRTDWFTTLEKLQERTNLEIRNFTEEFTRGFSKILSKLK